MPQPIQANAHAARYRLPDESGPAATYYAEDVRGHQYLLEVWLDGTYTVATRQWSWATWGAPVTLGRVGAEAAS